MEDYEVKADRSASYKLLGVCVFWMIWSYTHLPVIDLLIGYTPNLEEENFDLAYVLVKKKALFQAYFTTIPLILLFSYLGYYCLKVIKYKKIPPPGNGFPFRIERVKYRDHYTFGYFGIFIALILLYFSVRHLHETTRVFGI